MIVPNCKCLGVILLTFKSLEAFPANSNTSAVKYSNIAALYTAAVAPTLWCNPTLAFKYLWTLPTGNCNPALCERDVGAFLPELETFPLPPLDLPPFAPLLPPDLPPVTEDY